MPPPRLICFGLTDIQIRLAPRRTRDRLDITDRQRAEFGPPQRTSEPQREECAIPQADLATGWLLRHRITHPEHLPDMILPERFHAATGGAPQPRQPFESRMDYGRRGGRRLVGFYVLLIDGALIDCHSPHRQQVPTSRTRLHSHVDEKIGKLLRRGGERRDTVLRAIVLKTLPAFGISDPSVLGERRRQDGGVDIVLAEDG